MLRETFRDDSETRTGDTRELISMTGRDGVGTRGNWLTEPVSVSRFSSVLERLL